jgi:hypothetical protein
VTRDYHITFETVDGRIVEADVEATFTPGEGFDGFVFDDVVITDQKTGLSEDFTFMPEDLVSEAEYAAEGQMPVE